MSLYTLLESPVPTIAYCATHQARPEIPRAEYLKTMKELHERIQRESVEINAALEKHHSDVIVKESQNLRNTLAHYLQTPISSDAEDVHRILVESFERIQGQLLDPVPAGLVESLEGEVFFATSKKSLEKRLLKNGKAYLDKLGFMTVKGAPAIFESMFIVKGAANLDVLEHIVRDRLGIYSTTHGKHIAEFGGYSYAVYNLAYAKGKLPANGAIDRYTDLTFFFSKPDMKYAPFRAGIIEAVEKLTGGVSVDHIALWQRKLGLGGGKEFRLQIVTENSETALDALQWLNDYEEHPFVRDVIVVNGSLVVKELLFKQP